VGRSGGDGDEVETARRLAAASLYALDAKAELA
jgi:hypothetical protein